MRLYLDEDSQSRAFVRALRHAGHDVLTTAQANQMSAADSQQLAFATSEQRMIVTANRHDYARLHGEWMGKGHHHAGILLRRQGVSPGELARQVGMVEERQFGMQDHIVWLPISASHE